MLSPTFRRSLLLRPRIPSSIHLRLSSTATPKSYYDLFPRSLPDGAPPKGPFAIDATALKREFFQLQQSAHPDVASHRPSSTSTSASTSASASSTSPAASNSTATPSSPTPSSAYINTAYRTLLDPLTRAQYILAQRGHNVEDETAQIHDQGLLMMVLEVQEEIEAAASEEELEGVKRHNEERIERCVGELEEAFKADDMDTAKRVVVELRYWRNVKKTLEEWEPGREVVLPH